MDWFPVLTLVLGAVLAFVADCLREGKAASREREAAHDAFQHETLLALQDAIAKLRRAAGEIYLQDEMRYRETGRYGRDRPSPTWDAALSEASMSIQVHRVRILDDEIRGDAAAVERLARQVAVPARGDGLEDEPDDVTGSETSLGTAYIRATSRSSRASGGGRHALRRLTTRGRCAGPRDGARMEQ
jgi:hypothetical protein